MEILYGRVMMHEISTSIKIPKKILIVVTILIIVEIIMIKSVSVLKLMLMPIWII